MKFHCPNCNAKYRITEEKFASHPNPKLRCKQCSTVFSVKAALAAEPTDGPVSISPPAAPNSSQGDDAVVSASGSIAPAAPPSVLGPSAVLPLGAPKPGASALGGQAGAPRPRPAMAGLAPSLGAIKPKTPSQTPPPPKPAGASVPPPATAAKKASLPVPAPRPTTAAGAFTPAPRPLAPKPGAPPRPTTTRGPAVQDLRRPLKPGRAGIGGSSVATELTVDADAPLATDTVVEVPPDESENGRITQHSLETDAALVAARSDEPAAPSSGISRGALSAALQSVQHPAPSLPPPSSRKATSLAALAMNSALPPAAAAFGGVTASTAAGAGLFLAPSAVASVPELATGAASLDGWYLECEGTPLGPLDEVNLRMRTLDGALQYDTLVWREGIEDWKEAVQYPVLRGLITELRGEPPPNEQVAGTALDTAASVGTRPMTSPESSASAALSYSAAHSMERGISLPPAVQASGIGAGVVALLVVLALAVGFGAGYWFAGQGKVFASGNTAPVAQDAPHAERVGAAPPPPPPLEVSAARQPARVTSAEKKEEARSRDRESAQPARAAAAAEVAPPAEPSGGGLLAGLSVPASGDGPQANESAAGGKAAGGASLDANAIQSTVQKYQPGVRRNCWQRALASAVGASSSARVTVTIKIAPSGKVTSVNHSGDPSGYPGLASCIALKVKEWSFPAAGGPTTAEVPFVFAAQ